MSTPKHTPGRWYGVTPTGDTPRPDSWLEISNDSGLHRATEADYAHIVECHNACLGINPAAVPELLKYAQIRADILKRNFGDTWADSDEGKMVSAALKLAKGS